MKYWLSWHQPTEDCRPLTYPPVVNVLGWWCSGYDADEVAQLCALVRAKSKDDAKAVIQTEWPEAERWRFISSVADDYMPGDRFPLEAWMQERIIGGAA